MSGRRHDALRGKPWTKGEIQLLRNAYLRGTQYKMLVDQLGRSEGAISCQVVKLRKEDPEGWPLRKCLKKKNLKVSVQMPEKIFRRARQRAAIRGSSMSRYIQLLIERDA